MRKVLREILITWLVLFGATQTSGLNAKEVDPRCRVAAAHLAPRPFPQWAQWSAKDWENFSKHLRVEAIEHIAIEKGGPYPLGHKDVLREFGINLDAGNIDFRIFLKRITEE